MFPMNLAAGPLMSALPGLLGGKQMAQPAPPVPLQGTQGVANTQDTPSPFDQILGGIDTGLQSPSQLMGLGLLSRLTNQNPYAGLGGLLAMGLYNRNK